MRQSQAAHRASSNTALVLINASSSATQELFEQNFEVFSWSFHASRVLLDLHSISLPSWFASYEASKSSRTAPLSIHSGQYHPSFFPQGQYKTFFFISSGIGSIISYTNHPHQGSSRVLMLKSGQISGVSYHFTEKGGMVTPSWTSSLSCFSDTICNHLIRRRGRDAANSWLPIGLCVSLLILCCFVMGLWATFRLETPKLLLLPPPACLVLSLAN